MLDTGCVIEVQGQNSAASSQIWNESVLKYATDLVAHHLSTGGGKVPSQLATGGYEVIEPSTRSKTSWEKYECEFCKCCLNGEHEWEIHLKSKRHKKARSAINKRKRQQDQAQFKKEARGGCSDNTK